MAGRPQESSRTGATYQLAEFMNRNWDMMVGRTNEDVAQELGYKAANMISMWRTGKTRVPLERLPDVARLMKLDISVLLPLWFEQQWGERADLKPLQTLFKRFATPREAELLFAIREADPKDPVFTPETVKAVVAVITDPAVKADVLSKIKASA